MTIAKIRLLAAAVLIMTLLAACGDGANPSVAESASPTASASPAASPTAGGSASAAPARVAAFVPGLSAENVSILDSCLAGDDGACDRAQEPERLTDTNFTRINAACSSGNQDACNLKDRLVEAELRMHCANGDVTACVTPTP